MDAAVESLLDTVTLATLVGMLIVAAACGLIPASIARKKGRSFFAWWLFGATLFGIAWVAAVLIKPHASVASDSDAG